MFIYIINTFSIWLTTTLRKNASIKGRRIVGFFTVFLKRGKVETKT